MDTEQHILCLAARTRLEAGDRQRLLELLGERLDWARLWEQAHLHDVLPLLTATLRSLQEQASMPQGWMARAQRRFYATLLRNTTLADELVRVCGALGASGVEALPVKGVVLAETLYGSLALRPAADLDLLVRPRDLPAAREVLGALGFARRAEPSPAALRHPFHDPQYFHQAAGGEVCLELHWALWDPRFFRLDADSLWERAVAARIHGAALRILSAEDTLLHLAIHRSRSPLRLRFVCDIAELLRRHAAALDWDYLLDQAGVAGARTALYSALALAEELLGAPLPEGLLPRLGVGRLKRRLLEYACGAPALFQPTAPDDLDQWPNAPLRPLVLDNSVQLTREIGYKFVRNSWRQLRRHRRSGR